MFRHHAWATLQLIDYGAGLVPGQLSASVPGTRGPILETLEHIVSADQGYKPQSDAEAASRAAAASAARIA